MEFLLMKNAHRKDDALLRKETYDIASPLPSLVHIQWKPRVMRQRRAKEKMITDSLETGNNVFILDEMVLRT